MAYSNFFPTFIFMFEIEFTLDERQELYKCASHYKLKTIELTDELEKQKKQMTSLITKFTLYKESAN